MARRNEHIVIGACAGGIIYSVYCWVADKEWSLKKFSQSLGLGALAGMLPDLMEPAINPNHRAFFHSLGFSAVVSYGVKYANKSQALTDAQKSVLNVLGAGYLSHLGLDIMTPKRLPLV
ncbi:MAG: metal-dependent hydrolase [Candidatus Saelkia tenebricola]|nr:metal-dependent hydrolase [Candidatus Saelkia tenebricola]